MRGVFTYGELEKKIREAHRYSRILVSGFWIIVFLTAFLFGYTGYKYFYQEGLPQPSAAPEASPEPEYKVQYGAVAMLMSEKGQGSAFLLKNGFVLTAQHVVKDQKNVTLNFIKLNLSIPAEVLTIDPKYDFALLKVVGEAPRISPLTLGDSDLVEEGEDVIVVGYPKGEWGITKGTLSLKSAERLKTDAATNPGNSGGPLVYKKENRVIGIIFATRPEAEGMHYAVPINRVKEVLQTKNYSLQ